MKTFEEQIEMYETRLQDIEHEKQQMKTEMVEVQEQQREAAQVQMVIPTENENDETLPYVFSARNGNDSTERLKNTSTNQKSDNVNQTSSISPWLLKNNVGKLFW